VIPSSYDWLVTGAAPKSHNDSNLHWHGEAYFKMIVYLIHVD